jgi:hypothetical protein
MRASFLSLPCRGPAKLKVSAPVHVDAREVHILRAQRPRGHDLFHLCGRRSTAVHVRSNDVRSKAREETSTQTPDTMKPLGVDGSPFAAVSRPACPKAVRSVSPCAHHRPATVRTSAIVTRAALAMSGLKLRAVPRNMTLPRVSATAPFTSAKSPGRRRREGRMETKVRVQAVCGRGALAPFSQWHYRRPPIWHARAGKADLLHESISQQQHPTTVGTPSRGRPTFDRHLHDVAAPVELP